MARAELRGHSVCEMDVALAGEVIWVGAGPAEQLGELARNALAEVRDISRVPVQAERARRIVHGRGERYAFGVFFMLLNIEKRPFCLRMLLILLLFKKSHKITKL